MHRLPRLLVSTVLAIFAASTSAAARDDPLDWREQRPRLQRRRWDALEGRPAPALATLAPWMNGPPQSWRSLSGRLVLVHIWHVADPAPEARLKGLAALATRFASDLTVLAVHAGDAPDAVRDLLARHDLRIPAAIDASGAFVAALAVRQPPATFLVDRAGHMRVAGLAADGDPARGGRLAQVIAAVAAESSTASTPGELPQLGPDGWPARVGKELGAVRDARGQRAPPLSVERWLRPPEPSPEQTGERVTLVFFAPSHPAGSAAAMQPVQDLHERFAATLLVLVLWPDSPNAAPRELAPGVTFAHGVDEGDRLASALGVSARPHALIHGTDGIVRWQGRPDDPADPLNAALIESLVARDALRRNAERTLVTLAAGVALRCFPSAAQR